MTYERIVIIPGYIEGEYFSGKKLATILGIPFEHVYVQREHNTWHPNAYKDFVIYATLKLDKSQQKVVDEILSRI